MWCPWVAIPPAQPALCWHKAGLGGSLRPAGSSASLARRQWVDPFRTEVYSGEISGFCRISSAGTGINKETRLLLAPVFPPVLPWAPARWCAGSVPWGQRRGQLHRPHPTKPRWDKDRQDTSEGTRSRNQPSQSLALQSGPPCSPWDGVFFHGPQLPEGILQTVLASCICLMTVRPLCSLSSSCQRWDGHAPGRGFASPY